MRELKEAARAQVEAARAAPARAKEAARARVRMALERLVGPRAAESIMSGSTSLHPAVHARAAMMNARAFAARHAAPIGIVSGGVATAAVWRGMFVAASAVTEVNDAVTHATMGGLSVALVVIGGIALKQRYGVNPERVYAATMRLMERHHGLREVLGAPIVGSELRATVITGGTWRVSRMSPRWREAKVHLVFPVSGTRKSGVVTVEAKKKGGGYDYKLVAVDVAAPNGDEHRVYLAGGSEAYTRGEVMGMQLREPLLSAMSEVRVARRIGPAGPSRPTKHEQPPSLISIRSEAARASFPAARRA